MYNRKRNINPDISQGQALSEVTEGIKQNPFSKLMRAATLLSLLEARGKDKSSHEDG